MLSCNEPPHCAHRCVVSIFGPCRSWCRSRCDCDYPAHNTHTDNSFPFSYSLAPCWSQKPSQPLYEMQKNVPCGQTCSRHSFVVIHRHDLFVSTRKKRKGRDRGCLVVHNCRGHDCMSYQIGEFWHMWYYFDTQIVLFLVRPQQVIVTYCAHGRITHSVNLQCRLPP